MAFVGPWDDGVTHRNPFLLMYDVGLLLANAVILCVYYCYGVCLSNKILIVTSPQVILIHCEKDKVSG